MTKQHGNKVMRIAHMGLLSVAFLGSSGFAGPAMAGAEMKRPEQIVVSTNDLDLSTDSGVRTARARVRRAAEQACGDYPRVGILPPVEIGRCRMMAARQADARIVALASRASDEGIALADANRRAQ